MGLTVHKDGVEDRVNEVIRYQISESRRKCVERFLFFSRLY